ncbi:hypothetical protein VT03_05920 [Planctomyces sp. SH-PL14]|nr:hypothetical protein VT03_05920 [Planctomyces sp. SH-PL14]
MDWMEEQHHQEMAAKTADELIARLKMKPPINPLAIAQTESDILKFAGGDLGSRYDGKLEYVKSRGLFLLYYNTKYDIGLTEGQHHPRTLFSVSHELGHFFIDHHHQCLRRGVKPHRSKNEFRSHRQIEREADAFAASLMMPTVFARPMVNESPLSMDRIGDIAGHFGASLVSAAIRSVRLSDYPCALAGIRNGRVAWMFPSESLVNAGIYPKRGGIPENAEEPWEEMTGGSADSSQGDGTVADWFDTFSKEDLDDIYVGEEYLPVQVTETLVVLLTLDEDELAEEEEEDEED